jgi:hypothetical protein
MIEALIDFCHINGGRKITAPVAKENIGSNEVLKNLTFMLKKKVPLKNVRLTLYMMSIYTDLI